MNEISIPSILRSPTCVVRTQGTQKPQQSQGGAAAMTGEMCGEVGSGFQAGRTRWTKAATMGHD